MYSGEPLAGAVYAFRRRTGMKAMAAYARLDFLFSAGATEEVCDLICELDECSFAHNPPQRWVHDCCASSNYQSCYRSTAYGSFSKSCSQVIEEQTINLVNPLTLIQRAALVPMESLGET